MIAKRLRSALHSVTDESLRAATVVGLLSVPFTLAVSQGVSFERVARDFSLEHIPLAVPLESLSTATVPDHLSLWPLLAAGVVVGLVYGRREIDVGPAGKRTGVVGSIPVLLQSADAFGYVWFGSIGWPLIGTAFILAYAFGGVVLSVVVAMVGAKIGAWFTGTTDSSRPMDADA